MPWRMNIDQSPDEFVASINRRARQKYREEKAEKEARKRARAERNRASMKYRATVNIDVTDQRAREYQRLIAALMQAGWKYIETSALAFEGDLPNVFTAMKLISRQGRKLGNVSAITFHAQGSTDFNGKEYPAAKNHPHALRDILGEGA